MDGFNYTTSRRARRNTPTPDGPVCPQCEGPVTYTSTALQVTCRACGLVLTLTPEQNSDYLDAVLGLLPTLNLGLMLREVGA